MSQTTIPENEQYLTAEQENVQLKERIAQLEKENAKLKELAVIDEKTGLLNEKCINAIIDAAVEKRQRAIDAERPYDSLSVICADLDGLKQFNDQYGHRTGNAAIYSSGQAIAKSIRRYDSGGHPHGEEYIVLVEGDLEAAILVAQRIRKKLPEEGAGSKLPVCPTLSIGITEFQPGDTRDTLCHQADQAMYRVKKHGKNGIAIGGVSENRLQDVIKFINSPVSSTGLVYNPEQDVFREKL